MKSGTVVVFEPNNFNREFWKQFPEQDKIKYYGPLGYGSDKKKFFVFLTEIKNAPGHCILVDRIIEDIWQTSKVERNPKWHDELKIAMIKDYMIDLINPDLLDFNKD